MARPTWWRRVVQWAGHQPWFARIGPKVFPKLDRFVHRLTGGRVLPSATFLPGCLLTTTGRKSGEPRQVPVACFPEGDGLVVVASNFGRAHHPAWSLNLLADPHATVDFRGDVFPVRARVLSDDEKAEVWPGLVRRWPAFDTYAKRAGRDIRLFHLERTSP